MIGKIETQQRNRRYQEGPNGMLQTEKYKKKAHYLGSIAK